MTRIGVVRLTAQMSAQPWQLIFMVNAQVRLITQRRDLARLMRWA